MGACDCGTEAEVGVDRSYRLHRVARVKRAVEEQSEQGDGGEVRDVEGERIAGGGGGGNNMTRRGLNDPLRPRARSGR